MKELLEWHEIYTIETQFKRSIPSILDGQKPVHRKIFFTALKELKGKKNTSAFSGNVKSESNYEHGDVSIVNSVNNLTSDFKNHIPMFIGHGAFGDRLSKEPSAPRYTEVSLNPEFTKYRVMPELENCTIQDDNKFYEPDNYFFLIPMVLVNGSQGIAVKMKTSILAYDTKEIIKNIKLILDGKKQKKMIPVFPKFVGSVKYDGKTWVQSGIIEAINTTKIKITEIPTSYDRVEYKKVLQKMVEEEKIVGYEDNCKDSIEYIIKTTRAQSTTLKKVGLLDSFRLNKNLQSQINVLNPSNTEILNFDTAEDLVEEYVDLMIKKNGYIQNFIRVKIEEWKEEIRRLNLKMDFIQYVSGLKRIGYE